MKQVRKSVLIADLIQKDVLNSQLVAGQSLNELELSRIHKVSRVVVRESLSLLAGRGIVTYTYNKGASLVELDLVEVNKIICNRMYLEALVLLLARKHATEPEKRKLQSAFKELNTYSKCRTHDEFIKLFTAHTNFHRFLWDLSHNPFLKDSLDRLCLPLWLYYLKNRSLSSDNDFKNAPARHKPLLDFVLAEGQNHQSIQGLNEQSQALISVHAGSYVSGFMPPVMQPLINGLTSPFASGKENKGKNGSAMADNS